MLINYIKTLVLLFIVITGLLYIYILGELFLVFKQRTFEIFLSYTLNFFPVAFFYGGAFVAGLALVVVLRSLMQRKIDLLVQSFSISPLRLSSYFILLSLFMCAINLYGSYQLYGKSQKKLYRIEREYKKAKGTESGLVRNLWLKQQVGSQTLFYNFELVEVSSGRLYGFFLLRVDKSSITELITARAGTWEGKSIRLKEASHRDLASGEEKVMDLTLEYLSLEQIEPLAERPEHLSLREVLMLSLLGEKAGVRYRQYVYEILRRVLISILPAPITLTLSWVYLRWRNLKLTLLMLISLFSAHWFLLNFIKSLIENTDLSLWVVFLLYLPLPFISLKGLYDLAKGFRV